jgi:hypothetical protein
MSDRGLVRLEVLRNLTSGRLAAGSPLQRQEHALSDIRQAKASYRDQTRPLEGRSGRRARDSRCGQLRRLRADHDPFSSASHPDIHIGISLSRSGVADGGCFFRQCALRHRDIVAQHFHVDRAQYGAHVSDFARAETIQIVLPSRNGPIGIDATPIDSLDPTHLGGVMGPRCVLPFLNPLPDDVFAARVCGRPLARVCTGASDASACQKKHSEDVSHRLFPFARKVQARPAGRCPGPAAHLSTMARRTFPSRVAQCWTCHAGDHHLADVDAIGFQALSDPSRRHHQATFGRRNPMAAQAASSLIMKPGGCAA